MYNGNEPYIFISYAHKDFEIIHPIITDLEKRGFRIWYDNGIEAGSEWPEYIAEKLMNANVVLAFLSENSLNSQNCRREINFAIEMRKDFLSLYLTDLQLTPGMRLQLNSLQAIFRNRSNSHDEFIQTLASAKILENCRIQQSTVNDFTVNNNEHTQSEQIDVETLETEQINIETSESEHIFETEPTDEYIADKKTTKMITVKETESTENDTKDIANIEFTDNQKAQIVFEAINICVKNFYTNSERDHILQNHELSSQQRSNAIKYLKSEGVEQDDIIGFIDATIFDTGKEAIVFTKDNLFYYSKSHIEEKLDLFSLASAQMDEKNFHTILTYDDGHITTTYLSIRKEAAVAILNTIVSIKYNSSRKSSSESDKTESKENTSQQFCDDEKLAIVEKAIKNCNSKLIEVRDSLHEPITLKNKLSKKQLDNALKYLESQHINEDDIVGILDTLYPLSSGKEGYVFTKDKFIFYKAYNIKLVLDVFDVKTVHTNDDLKLLIEFRNGVTKKVGFSLYKNSVAMALNEISSIVDNT